MMEMKSETTSIPGNWRLDLFGWKTEQVKLMGKFLAGLKEKQVLGLKCPGCGLVYVPPKPFCRCLERPEEWVEVSDEGVVTTFTFSGTWAFRGFEEADESETRIIVGYKLDGADTMGLSLLQGADPADVDVGMRVKIRWPDAPEGALKDILFVEPA